VGWSLCWSSAGGAFCSGNEASLTEKGQSLLITWWGLVYVSKVASVQPELLPIDGPTFPTFFDVASSFPLVVEFVLSVFGSISRVFRMI